MLASLHAITVSRGPKLYEKWLNLCPTNLLPRKPVPFKPPLHTTTPFSHFRSFASHERIHPRAVYITFIIWDELGLHSVVFFAEIPESQKEAL